MVEFVHLGPRRRNSKTQIPALVSWTRSPIGWIRLNTDGSTLGNPGLAGVGGFLRDSHASGLVVSLGN